MLLLLAIFTPLFLAITIESTSMICSSNLYGRPSASDSTAVAQALPFAKTDPDGQMDAGRIFAEPAFFQPRFSALKNTWPRDMVQLPMIWRFRSARLALLMHADAAGRVRSPSINMDWRTVQSVTTGVDKYCVEGRHSGGVWIVSDIFRDPYVSVYIYEAGSPFENVMNQYMITGKGINPFNPRGLGAEGIALNATVAGATLGGNAVLTATEVDSVPPNILPAVTGMSALGVELEIGSR